MKDLDADRSARLSAHWPLFGLRLRVGDLELRCPRDEDLAALVDVARAGVHPPERMPFCTAWTDAASPEFERGFLQYHWGLRAGWKASSWSLDFAVARGGEFVGCQGLFSRDFAVTRTVETGSWLGQAFQGQGIGVAMRAAVLELAFAELGALEARSGAFTDNPSSAAVSAKLGYIEDGTRIHVRRGERACERRFVLRREDWEGRARPSVEVTGLDGCRSMFGA